MNGIIPIYLPSSNGDDPIQKGQHQRPKVVVRRKKPLKRARPARLKRMMERLPHIAAKHAK